MFWRLCWLRMDSSQPNVVEPFASNIFKRVSKWKGNMWNVRMGIIVFENVPFNWEKVKKELLCNWLLFILYLYYDLRNAILLRLGQIIMLMLTVYEHVDEIVVKLKMNEVDGNIWNNEQGFPCMTKFIIFHDTLIDIWKNNECQLCWQNMRQRSTE